MRQVSYVLSNPPAAVVLNDLGASTVDLLLFVWIADAEDEKAAFFAVLEAAKYALDKAGIELPFPQLDLTVRSVEPPVWENAAAKLIRANGR